jgi:hypothetical protein
MTTRQREKVRWGLPFLAVLALAGAVRVGYAFLARATKGATNERTSTSSAASSEANTASPRPAYPPGKWRLAPHTDLGHVVLWVSNILIRHNQADPVNPPFGPHEWKVEPHLPARTRNEAMAVAEIVAEKARRDPAHFAELAREFSEDITTRDAGGTLGGIVASQFLLLPEVLDALAALSPGETSKVVESRHGFHILQRREIPNAVDVAGRRIVIGHKSASWLKYRQREGKIVERSRAEALELAGSIVREARAAPERMGELVEKYSEHADAEQGGDVGVWSNREVSPFPRAIEWLARAKAGDVSEPIETQIGFEIFQRVSVEPRAAYAATVLKLRFSPGATDDNAKSAVKVRALAESIGRVLATDPHRFSDFQREYCCERVERWTQGRGELALAREVEKLAIGAVSSEPIAIDQSYILVRRLAPEDQAEEEEVRFELPVPVVPDLERMAGKAAGPMLASLTRSLAESAKHTIDLTVEQVQDFDRIHAELAKKFEATSSPEQRVLDLRETQRELERILGRDKFDAYWRFVEGRVTEMLMKR